MGGNSLEGSGAVGPQLALCRAVWRVFCGAFVVLGVAATGLLLPAQIPGLVLLAALAAGVCALGLYDGGIRARWTRRQVVTFAAAAAAMISWALALTVVLGPSVLWLMGLLAVTSPRAVLWYGRFGSAAGNVDVPKRSTVDLCRQWRDSYEALRQATTDKQRLRIVMERQHCLDELGRRDPEGLQAWLASSASAAGDPARFLKGK